MKSFFFKVNFVSYVLLYAGFGKHFKKSCTKSVYLFLIFLVNKFLDSV